MSRSVASSSASARSAPSAGSSDVSTGSGSQGPTYVSRRARADVAALIASRVVTVVRKAAAFRTWSRSVPCQRSQASCTTSSASATPPSIR